MGFSTVTSSIILFSSLVISLTLIGSTLLNSWYNMAVAIRDREDFLEKPEIVIEEANVSCDGINLVAKIRNNGPGIIWDFYSADLIVAYVNANGVKNSYLLSYNTDWGIIYIESSYGKPLNYTEGMGLYPGESMVINATLPSPASLDHQILVVFVDQHGAIAYYRWLGGVCYG